MFSIIYILRASNAGKDIEAPLGSDGRVTALARIKMITVKNTPKCLFCQEIMSTVNDVILDLQQKSPARSNPLRRLWEES